MNKIKIKISEKFFDKGVTNVNDMSHFLYSYILISDFSFLGMCRGLVEKVEGE